MARRRKASAIDGLELRLGDAVAGVITGQVLRKTVHGRRHMLHSPRGWAVDKAVLEAAEAAGCVECLVVDLDDDGREYLALLASFRSLGITINRGHGVQVCLPLAAWKTAEQLELPRAT